MKFIVKVKVVEKSVNSVVGRVMVLKVMTQSSKLGITRRILRITRPRRPKVETCAAWAGRPFARELFTVPVVLARTVEALLAAEATEFAAAMAVMGGWRLNCCRWITGQGRSRSLLQGRSSLEQEDLGMVVRDGASIMCLHSVQASKVGSATSLLALRCPGDVQVGTGPALHFSPPPPIRSYPYTPRRSPAL